MAEKVASLYAEIGADVSGLTKGLGQTKAGLNTASKQMTMFGGTTKDTIKQLVGLSVAGGLAYKAIDGIADFFKSSVNDTMNYAKSVRDVSRALGISSQEASKIIQIADDVEVSVESLTMGFKAALKQGIVPSIDGLKGLAVEYRKLSTPAEKAQFALEKFGRSGLEMQKFLELAPGQIDEMAASAERLGLVLSQEEIAKTEEYRIAVDELTDAWGGLKTEVGMGVIPVLSNFITLMNEMLAMDSKTWFKDGADAAAKFLNNLFGWNDGATDTEEHFAMMKRKAEDLFPAIAETGDAFDEASKSTQKYTKVLDLARTDTEEARIAQMLFGESFNVSLVPMLNIERQTLLTKLATEDLTEAEQNAILAELDLIDVELDLLNTNKKLGFSFDEAGDAAAEAAPKLRDFMDAADRQITSPLSEFIKDMKFLQAGGMWFDEAKNALLEAMALTPQESMDIAANLVVGVEVKANEAGLIAKEEMIKNISEGLQIPEKEAAALAEDFKSIFEPFTAGEQDIKFRFSLQGNEVVLQWLMDGGWENVPEERTTNYDVTGPVETPFQLDEGWRLVPTNTATTYDVDGDVGTPSALKSEWAGVPRNVTTVYTVKYVYEGERITYDDGKKNAPGRPGGQHGLDMIVPQGFPGDTFPIFASSGERVTITPQHKMDKQGGGDTYNIYNNSTGAAALTMALIQQQHRARLGRSMGG